MIRSTFFAKKGDVFRIMCSGIVVSRHPGECWAPSKRGLICGRVFPAMGAKQMADVEFFAVEKFEGMEAADKGFYGGK